MYNYFLKYWGCFVIYVSNCSANDIIYINEILIIELNKSELGLTFIFHNSDH